MYLPLTNGVFISDNIFHVGKTIEHFVMDVVFDLAVDDELVSGYLDGLQLLSREETEFGAVPQNVIVHLVHVHATLVEEI